MNSRYPNRPKGEKTALGRIAYKNQLMTRREHGCLIPQLTATPDWQAKCLLSQPQPQPTDA